jgi:hypothetical protein
MNKLDQTMENVIDVMGETYFSRFMDFVDNEDLETSKALMDEWIVDGVDPQDGGVEFIWVEK